MQSQQTSLATACYGTMPYDTQHACMYNFGNNTMRSYRSARCTWRALLRQVAEAEAAQKDISLVVVGHYSGKGITYTICTCIVAYVGSCFPVSGYLANPLSGPAMID